MLSRVVWSNGSLHWYPKSEGFKTKGIHLPPISTYYKSLKAKVTLKKADLNLSGTIFRQIIQDND
jgi:hypothetical protein